jgi:hypothetical protein
LESAWQIDPDKNGTANPLAGRYTLHTPTWKRKLKTPSARSKFAFVTDGDTNVTGVEIPLNPSSHFHQNMERLKAKKTIQTPASMTSNKGTSTTSSSKATSGAQKSIAGT